MHVADMHYQIKKKLNKVDSSQYRNLYIPEIDTALNEAQEIFIKLVAFPRYSTLLGFEKNNRVTDDIRTIVENENNIDNHYEVTENSVALPDDYLYYVSSHLYAEKKSCQVKIIPTFVQHDDNPEENGYYKSSFEWRRTNMEFDTDGVRFYTDGSFDITKFCISYIRKPKHIHYAEGFDPNGYELPSGVLLQGSENCELPDHVHSEIVDLAVMFLTGEIEKPGYEQTVAKLKLNQLT